MHLYRLRGENDPHGVELTAEGDQQARAVAADTCSQALHDNPHAFLERRRDDRWVRLEDPSQIVPAHPPRAPAPDPRPGEPRPLDRFRLYEDDGDRLRFGELSESLRQVERALRQLGRAQAAHRAEQAKHLELGFTEGRVPQELVDLGVERSDAMEFAIIAANRAVKAHRYLTQIRGLDLPGIQQGDLVGPLRDLYEHWEEWKVAERESFLNDNRFMLTRSAGKRWRATGGGRPEGSMGASASPPPGPAADPQGRIKSWNGIDIDQLTTDLETLRDAIAVHEQAAFEWEMPDERAVVELVGATMWSLIHLFTTVRGRRARDGVVRWERAWLLAADQKVREQHWVINGEVVGPHATEPPEQDRPSESSALSPEEGGA